MDQLYFSKYEVQHWLDNKGRLTVPANYRRISEARYEFFLPDLQGYKHDERYSLFDVVMGRNILLSGEIRSDIFAMCLDGRELIMMPQVDAYVRIADRRASIRDFEMARLDSANRLQLRDFLRSQLELVLTGEEGESRYLARMEGWGDHFMVRFTNGNNHQEQ